MLCHVSSRDIGLVWVDRVQYIQFRAPTAEVSCCLRGVSGRKLVSCV